MVVAAAGGGGVVVAVAAVVVVVVEVVEIVDVVPALVVDCFPVTFQQNTGIKTMKSRPVGSPLAIAGSSRGLCPQEMDAPFKDRMVLVGWSDTPFPLRAASDSALDFSYRRSEQHNAWIA